ncbi:hypothetical protein [Tautonia rosea]|uniref:hypothetical protein n=1 Tax=Tautonia rosea TaxID=2728037 RepID=UPI00147367E3|nr:hypothetical protein [Tautonia rosea]
MSIDVSRVYIFPIERLADAFAAAAEIAPRPREPRDFTIALPNGTSIRFPFAPRGNPPYALELDDFNSFEYRFRASGDDIEEYVRENPEPPFVLKRLKGGGLRGIFELILLVSVEPPYASFSFNTRCTSDCDVLGLRSVCEVLDFIGRCAEGLVTYEMVMGDRKIVEPFDEDLPPEVGVGDESELASIVAYVRRLEGA